MDCKIAILSVAGSERGGKSFILNYILRYLASDEETFGEPDEELRGLTIDRETSLLPMVSIFGPNHFLKLTDMERRWPYS